MNKMFHYVSICMTVYVMKIQSLPMTIISVFPSDDYIFSYFAPYFAQNAIGEILYN